ncbi:hypothetical protein CDAR_39181 [Caerostris darwini]|uniref:Uncharacterized protein n=1 Tax=Caerostris darwini TaxID=1538125 RepID=A0AAV4UQY4_9ARAC|nr:hypothetical protein CDAR_39181 [Caerostris darwini]
MNYMTPFLYCPGCNTIPAKERDLLSGLSLCWDLGANSEDSCLSSYLKEDSFPRDSAESIKPSEESLLKQHCKHHYIVSPQRSKNPGRSRGMHGRRRLTLRNWSLIKMNVPDRVNELHDTISLLLRV